MKKKKLTNWVSKLEALMPSIKEEPGHFYYNGLSAEAVADWCDRLQQLEEKNRMSNGGESRFAVFDLETTGLHSAEEFASGIGGITDVGCSLLVNGEYRGNEVLEDGTQIEGANEFEFDRLSNPGVEIPDVVVELTGITNEMVGAASKQDDVLTDFRKFTEGAILVGHNIGDDQFSSRGFDVKRVYGPIAVARFGDDLDQLLGNSVDTLPLFTHLISGVPHTNAELGRRLGFTLVGAHRAMPDVRVNALSFAKLLPILLDCPVEDLRERAKELQSGGVHVVTHVQPGAVLTEDMEERWVEFGVKLDRKHLKLKGRKQVLMVRYDQESDQFLFEETEFADAVRSGAEIADLLQPEILKRQACILKQKHSFVEVLDELETVVF